ncbi:hypothetical protein ACLI4R_17510 [Natrialbaceae archaeon A-chndr2]
MKSDDNPANDNDDSDAHKTPTTTLSFEISEELYERFVAAVEAKHGRYRGLKNVEGEEMIRAWTDEILGKGGVSNRDLQDELAEIKEMLQGTPTLSQPPRQTTKNADQSEITQRNRTEERVETAGIADTNNNSESNGKSPDGTEGHGEPDGGFWREYDPDHEYADPPIGEDEIKALPEIETEMEINPRHIDSIPYKGLDAKLELVVGVLRYHSDTWRKGDILDEMMTVLEYADESRREHRRTKFPRLLDKLYPHPKNEHLYVTSRSHLDEIEAHRLERDRDVARKTTALAVLTCRGGDHLAGVGSDAAKAYNTWNKKRHRMIEDSGVISGATRAIVDRALFETKEMEEYASGYESWMDDDWMESPEEMVRWYCDEYEDLSDEDRDVAVAEIAHFWHEGELYVDLSDL